jgi:hypothetical protein
MGARSPLPSEAVQVGRRSPEVRTVTEAKPAEDPGAYVGRLPERAAETIPGGVRPEDERVAAYQSEPAAPGEPGDQTSDDSEGTNGVADPRGPAEAAARASDPEDSTRDADPEAEVPEPYR